MSEADVVLQVTLLDSSGEIVERLEVSQHVEDWEEL
jgi:hypothetical protein